VLGKDATSATSRQVLGVPLYVSSAVAADTLWALDSSRVWLVLRDDVTVEADRSVFVTSVADQAEAATTRMIARRTTVMPLSAARHDSADQR
jgi:hypothetical protein